MVPVPLWPELLAKMNTSDAKTREPQYQRAVDLREAGLGTLGLMTNQAWEDDPRHLLFTLSRYKFVAKMLSGANHVLEVGCADAFGTRIVVQEVAKLTAVDFDPVFIADVKERMSKRWAFECHAHDMLSGPVDQAFDAAYALDVIEHIRPRVVVTEREYAMGRPLKDYLGGGGLGPPASAFARGELTTA